MTTIIVMNRLGETLFEYRGSVPRINDTLKKGDTALKVLKVVRTISDKKQILTPMGCGNYYHIVDSDDGTFHELAKVTVFAEEVFV